MHHPFESAPDLTQLRGVVAPEVLAAATVASQALRDAHIPHALAGGLAVGAHGYPRTTDDVNFLVGDEAFIHHLGGLVTLRVPLVAVGKISVDLVPIEEAKGETTHLRSAIDNPPESEQIPIVPLQALVYMKVKAGRQKDLADLVELLKRGKVDIAAIDEHLQKHALDHAWKWERVKEMAAREE